MKLGNTTPDCRYAITDMVSGLSKHQPSRRPEKERAAEHCFKLRYFPANGRFTDAQPLGRSRQTARLRCSHNVSLQIPINCVSVALPLRRGDQRLREVSVSPLTRYRFHILPLCLWQ